MQKKEHAKEAQTQKRIQELSSILDQGLAREEDREPAHEEEVKTESVRETPMEESETPSPRRPVDPNRISANEPEQGFSDLSVFRDIFPQL
mgnify:CR=1 FL=1